MELLTKKTETNKEGVIDSTLLLEPLQNQIKELNDYIKKLEEAIVKVVSDNNKKINAKYIKDKLNMKGANHLAPLYLEYSNTIEEISTIPNGTVYYNNNINELRIKLDNQWKSISVKN